MPDEAEGVREAREAAQRAKFFWAVHVISVLCFAGLLATVAAIVLCLTPGLLDYGIRAAAAAFVLFLSVYLLGYLLPPMSEKAHAEVRRRVRSGR